MISLKSKGNYATITDYGHFPDNTLLMKLMVDEENEIVWKYENDSELFAVYCIARHIKQKGFRVGLVMKYIPNARQDRVKEPRDVFTLKYFSELINSCGFDYVEVLDPHVKAIYGDSITIQRCKQIYEILMENGFACSNVALGVGSFSFQCVEEDGILKPFTRDTFSSCIKVTYCEINGEPFPIFKNPKDGGFKKSQKGCCVVIKDTNNKLVYVDGRTWDEAQVSGADAEVNLLETIFVNGKMVKEQNLADVRNVLHGGEF